MNWDRLARVGDPARSISLELAKSHLRVDGPDEDYLIDTLIQAATDHIEGPNGAGLSLAAQQWLMYAESFPLKFEIPIGPLVSVDSIAYIDTDGASQTLATSVYEVDIERGLIRAKTDQSWPSVDTVYKAITVTFTAGYSEIPSDLVAAMLLILGHLYKNREETVEKALTSIPMGAESIIDRYRRGRFG